MLAPDTSLDILHHDFLDLFIGRVHISCSKPLDLDVLIVASLESMLFAEALSTATMAIEAEILPKADVFSYVATSLVVALETRCSINSLLGGEIVDFHSLNQLSFCW